MEQQHRDQILNNIEPLIAATDYKQLIYNCVYYGLITGRMKQVIEERQQVGSPEQLQLLWHRRLFQKITHRGPDAFQLLKKIFIELNFTTAERILNQDNDDSRFISIAVAQKASRSGSSAPDGGSLSRQPAGSLKLLEYDKEIPKKFNVKKSEKIIKDDKAGVYSMKTQHHRGILFVANIINIRGELPRNGAKHDTDSLVEIFKAFGFKVYAYEDCTAEEFFKLLEKLLKSDHALCTESFVLALMSHGNINDKKMEYVQFADGALAPVSQIQELFSNHSCPHLVGKPKILLFPFCRGSVPDYGHNVTKGEEVETDTFLTNKRKASVSNVPTVSDVLICYASDLGFEAHRDPETGSWYIQTLCEKLANHAHDTSFETIVKIVQHIVGKRRSEFNALQTPSTVNIGFSKALYFNPGQWEDEQEFKLS